jgi:predicted kinase
MLVIVCGLPGSGKSTLSGLIAKEYSVVHLNSDSIRKKLFEKPEYTKAEKRIVYGEMRKQAAKLIQEGKDVILDATFYKKDFRDMMRDLSDGEAFVIRCILSEEETKRRLDKRQRERASPSDADYRVYKDVKSEFEPLEGPFLEVDYSLGSEKAMALVRRFLGEKHE